MKLVRKYIVNLRDLVHYSLTNFGRGKELHIAGMLSAEPSYHGSHEGDIKVSPDKPEEDGGHWYFSRKEIEENSPSRQDGIDLKKESYIRKSYCTYLQDLGMRLKVPQVTIATAIIFCHRFFIHQSHAKNDRRTIATVCMFLAGKVEETPRPLKDVILVSYEIIHKKDAAAAQRIKQKEVYEQQKELILQGEKIVLATLAFDLNVLHPYKPLVEAIKKFKVAQNALAQVAWNFVNDGLRTSLCLQFKPHHVAAGAIFLAAKFLKVKLPSDGEKVWWQEFNVTPRQLEVVSNQMLELYEQNRVPSSATEAEASAADSQQPPSNGGPGNKEHLTSDSSSHGRGPSKAASSKPSKPAPSGIASPQPHADNHNGHSESTQIRTSETNSNKDHKGDNATSCTENHEGQALSNQKDKHHARNLSYKNDTVVKSPHDAIKKIDKEKLKAAYERRKACGVITQKIDPVDELERELEDVELPGASDKIEHERKQSLSKPASRDHQEKKGQFLNGGGGGFDTVEDGEVENRSPRSSTHKRKAGSFLDTPMEGKQQNDHTSVSQKQNHDYPEEKNGSERLGYSEREHKKHMQENHVSLT